MRHRIGIDLGGTKIEGIVLDEHNTVLRRIRIATESEQGYEHIVGRVAALAEQLRTLAPECEAIGIGTPGAVSARTGLMKNCNTVCLNGRDLPGDLGRALSCRVLVENDANCFALAEAVAGAGRDHALVFGVIMGTGVGGGWVHKGELLRGRQHIAGEWGHHCLNAAGPTCYCGQHGCVECYLSGPGVAAQHRARTGEALTMDALVDRARTGEGAAVTTFEAFLDHFGRALANVISIVDPDVIVLGGGLSNIDELYDRGRAAVARYVFNDELRTPIVRHALGDSAGVIGAALLTP